MFTWFCNLSKLLVVFVNLHISCRAGAEAVAMADPSSGFWPSDSIFRSKRSSITLPEVVFLTLPAFLFQQPHFLNHASSKAAYIHALSGRTVSYGALRSHVLSVASGLTQQLGLLPRDVVLVLSPNSVGFIVVTLAVMSVGAVVTTTNPFNRPSEIAKQMRDAGAKYVATTPSLIHKVQDEIARHKLPLILMEEEGNATAEMPPGFTPCISLADLLLAKPSSGEILGSYKTRQEDTAALLYSSGTTGTSKGVMITHKNLIAQAHLLLCIEETVPWTSRTYIDVLPMFHVYGLAVFGCGVLAKGCTTVLMPRFDMAHMLVAIQKYRVTHMPAVPPILIALTKLRIVDDYDLSSLVEIGSGAAPLSDKVIAAFTARFPKVLILQGYGMTESTAVGSLTATREESKHYGSSGLIAPNTEAKIVDPEIGKPLPPNQQGEIWLRGPTIMKGYFGRPGETDATIDKERWLHTGDLGYIDSNGYLFVVDRLKELIKYKGLQVAPAELEALLLSHSEIVDAAVIPYPDDEAGQIPMAYVVRGPSSVITEVDVMKFVSEQVAPYKKIRRVEFVKSIPRSASGKILRRELVREASSKL